MRGQKLDGGTGQGPRGAGVDIDKLCSVAEYAKHRLDRILERLELTAGERRVAAVLFHAASNSEAARILKKTTHAIRAHRKSIYKRLEVHDQGEFVIRLAVELWRDLFVLIGPLLRDAVADRTASLAGSTPHADEVETARRTDQLTDDQWEILEPLLPRRRGGARGRREMLEAMVWFLRTDAAAWRAVPARYGPWRTVYGWFRRWRDDTTLDRVAQALQVLLADAGRIDWKRWASKPSRASRQPREGGAAQEETASDRGVAGSENPSRSTSQTKAPPTDSFSNSAIALAWPVRCPQPELGDPR